MSKTSPLTAFALSLLVAGCGAKVQTKGPTTPSVGYVVITAQDVPLELQLPGRTTAIETADVRPQVSGVIKARRFQEGSLVRQGQTLYEIDPSLYRAAVAQAQANLANAQAVLADTQARATRYKPLADIEAVAKQDYTDALALAKEAAAQVLLNRATLQTAQINLHFTHVPAPITGRIGRSLVTTGALVTNGQVTPLATIERLDPIFVDMPQSSAEIVALRRELSSGGAAASAATVRLILEDGTPYTAPGTLEFSEALVDPNTGSVTLRARFPNSQNLLLPGMYVRGNLSEMTVKNAILAPQQGVSRDPRGNATVYLLGPGNKAVLRTVTADRTVGDHWLVTSGLAVGDKVITEGLTNVKPGITVRPVLAGSPPRAPPAKASGGAGKSG
ncbi:MAG: MexE family multidrug efflux transporter periplasmic adaptor subunit [Phenylobacterium sp.]|nr:MexE family multidrug efflux transporter periplasmic adaptor subunit [Phenylobacterium sp.]